ncbi:MAG: radical SAM family heme chaperone HemW [Anaerolineae bacterium]|nr:radical SAM family heme chaperone HemW [Anaerolineae bacterium]
MYLHIPFCRTRCTYCAFNTYTDQADLINAYVQALCMEIRLLGRGDPVHTVYFGGGTPSLLSASQVAQILATVGQHFSLLPEAEITLEANPGTVRPGDWAPFRAAGVNRLSLGFQSAIAGELALFARDHTLDEVTRAVEDARSAGFDNLSLDLMYGTPGQSLKDWRHSLAFALDLAPQHLSAYALSLEPGTSLWRQVRDGRLPTPDDELAAEMYTELTEALAGAGFVQYEISNWARGERYACHNLQYWRNLPYLGLGAGAHGYIAGQRTVNVMRPEIYIRCLSGDQGGYPYPTTAATQSTERISREDAMFETIMTGLRLMVHGLSEAALPLALGKAWMNAMGR